MKLSIRKRRRDGVVQRYRVRAMNPRTCRGCGMKGYGENFLDKGLCEECFYKAQQGLPLRASFEHMKFSKRERTRMMSKMDDYNLTIQRFETLPDQALAEKLVLEHNLSKTYAEELVRRHRNYQQQFKESFTMRSRNRVWRI